MVTPPLFRERTARVAVTRALLAWGVVSGPFYLTVGLVQALTREGFDISRHALSLLMLGEHGWVQTANLGATGLMVLLTATGFARASGRRGVTLALGVFGVSLVVSSAFAPDPMLGFPPGSPASSAPTTSGMVHLASGGAGFVALALAAFAAARWFSQMGAARVARLSRFASVVIGATFFAGASLATRPVGVGLIWVAVVAGFGWLAAGSWTALHLASIADRTAPRGSRESRPTI
jgi:hypothetical protein